MPRLGLEKGSLMKKRRSTEQIVGLLRQADVDLGKGANVPDVCRRLGISQQTYYRWRTGHRREAVVAGAWIPARTGARSVTGPGR